ncbi:MAG: trypsin-like peptidase domain-containing protein [Gemmatimonadetes bacterium]|nr:trypsin-like peptidase domain-containing protein [Gemmatimonadota bacterium]
MLAGLGHGTGFFVRADNGRRFIVTNDHVVAGGNRISVLLDSSTHVLAHFVASDPQADLALIEIHNSFCADCAILELASASEFQALRAGAKVVAVGFPLHQQQTLTTGIVSAQADGAVFTDVTLNPGNSGGPLMALSGHVVAVNTFIDQGDIGSGISGSVAVGRLRNLIGQSDYVMQATLSIERLPFVADTYPMELLRRIATDPRTDIDVYRDFSGIKANRFVIDIATPAMHVSLQIERDEHVTRQRRQREDRARLPESSRYANLDAYRDWTRFVGGLNRPVISISVTPILGENLVGRTRFRGDLEGISLSRNGLAMTPVQGGTHPLRERDDVQLGRVARIDVIDTGVGIKQDDQKRLFKKFSQLDGSTSRPVGGTGLRLFISEQYVEMHGGRIGAESEYGKGSTFTVHLPLEQHAATDDAGKIESGSEQHDERPTSEIQALAVPVHPADPSVSAVSDAPL